MTHYEHSITDEALKKAIQKSMLKSRQKKELIEVIALMTQEERHGLMDMIHQAKRAKKSMNTFIIIAAILIVAACSILFALYKINTL